MFCVVELAVKVMVTGTGPVHSLPEKVALSLGEVMTTVGGVGVMALIVNVEVALDVWPQASVAVTTIVCVPPAVKLRLVEPLALALVPTPLNVMPLRGEPS